MSTEQLALDGASRPRIERLLRSYCVEAHEWRGRDHLVLYALDRHNAGAFCQIDQVDGAFVALVEATDRTPDVGGRPLLAVHVRGRLVDR